MPHFGLSQIRWARRRVSAQPIHGAQCVDCRPVLAHQLSRFILVCCKVYVLAAGLPMKVGV
jgi:hypothetical protein